MKAREESDTRVETVDKELGQAVLIESTRKLREGGFSICVLWRATHSGLVITRESSGRAGG
jgi:hypothetical protein